MHCLNSPIDRIVTARHSYSEQNASYTRWLTAASRVNDLYPSTAHGPTNIPAVSERFSRNAGRPTADLHCRGSVTASLLFVGNAVGDA